MDDTSVFRRFFVISNLIAELMQSFGGAMSGGMVSGSETIAPASTVGQVKRTTVDRYGADPFVPPVESSMPDMNEQINDAHNFP